MHPDAETFLRSLDDDAPPADAPPLLRAVWLGLRGDWHGAHGIAQDDDGKEAAWVHAWLHRIEGDESNAAYWYRRAGHDAPAGDTESEGKGIAASLLKHAS